MWVLHSQRPADVALDAGEFTGFQLAFAEAQQSEIVGMIAPVKHGEPFSDARWRGAEFADSGIADTENVRDFAVTEALGAGIEADLLLFGKPGDRAMKTRAAFAIEEKLLGIFTCRSGRRR